MFKLTLFALLMLLSPTTMAFSYTLEISEAKLQNKVSAMMPLEKKKYFFKVILSDPEIELIEGSNEIGIFTHVEVVGPKGIKGKGRAKIIGSLSYEAEKSEFFFNNAVIEKLEIDKVSDKYIPKIKTVVQIVARKMLAARPVYTLKEDNLKHKFAKTMLQSIEVKKKKLLVKLSVF